MRRTGAGNNGAASVRELCSECASMRRAAARSKRRSHYGTLVEPRHACMRSPFIVFSGGTARRVLPRPWRFMNRICRGGGRKRCRLPRRQPRECVHVFPAHKHVHGRDKT
ncbi:hypothetical protein MRX96_012012 [Rhipicephalus microplus]